MGCVWELPAQGAEEKDPVCNGDAKRTKQVKELAGKYALYKSQRIRTRSDCQSKV